MIKRIIRHGISKVFLAAAIIEARAHIILGAAIRRFLATHLQAERLRDWNMRQWRRGMLYNLKQFARFRNGEDDEGNK